MAKNNSKEQLENELNYTAFNLDKVKDKDNNDIIALTTLNVQKVETMLRCNPDYPQFFDYNLLNDSSYVNDIIKKVEEERKIKNKEDQFKYPSYYYIKALEKNHNDADRETYEYYIEAILRRINLENSTRASKKDISTIAKAIAGYINYNELISNLKNPNQDYEIIEYICMKGKNRNLSLATKFCHYMSFILFFGTDDADTYSIFDSVINDNLNNYVTLLGTESSYESIELKYLYKKNWKTIKKSYVKYQKTINNIIDKANISRNGFDHLVWYNNKNN